MDSDVEMAELLKLCHTHRVKTPSNPESNKSDNTQTTNHPTNQTINRLEFSISLFGNHNILVNLVLITKQNIK